MICGGDAGSVGAEGADAFGLGGEACGGGITTESASEISRQKAITQNIRRTLEVQVGVHDYVCEQWDIPLTLIAKYSARKRPHQSALLLLLLIYLLFFVIFLRSIFLFGRRVLAHAEENTAPDALPILSTLVRRARDGT